MSVYIDSKRRRRLRYPLLKKQGWKCALCHDRLTSPPPADRGTMWSSVPCSMSAYFAAVRNFQVVCEACNRAKGSSARRRPRRPNEPHDEYRRWLRGG